MDDRRGLLGQTEHWLVSKWVRIGWGERGVCSRKEIQVVRRETLVNEKLHVVSFGKAWMEIIYAV